MKRASRPNGLLCLAALAVAALASSGRGDDEPADRLPSPPAGQRWVMIWNDEFDGQAIDESKWEIRHNVKRKNYSVFRREGASLDGKGHLIMTIRPFGENYSHGGLRTGDRFQRRYGFYTGRFRFQSQPGHWPGFWLSGAGVTQVGNDGRDGTEIDIMEKPWLNDDVQHTLHWDGYGEHHRTASRKLTVPGLMSGWHTFGLWWTPEEYVFYVDGTETWRTTAGGVCQVPLGILVTGEVGRWSGDTSKAALPDSFSVDYVRVYELTPE